MSDLPTNNELYTMWRAWETAIGTRLFLLRFYMPNYVSEKKSMEDSLAYIRLLLSKFEDPSDPCAYFFLIFSLFFPYFFLIFCQSGFSSFLPRWPDFLSFFLFPSMVDMIDVYFRKKMKKCR